ncbi:MAG TPA: hypothetical protein VGR90_02490 [Acidimicrobiales bacterium]|nr:hypothetical protein [Acidimicrobiales bacterium]
MLSARRLRSALALLPLAAGSLALAGCEQRAQGVDYQSFPLPNNHVEAINNSFVPHVIDVNAGQTVTWSFGDSHSPHNVYIPSLGVASPTKTSGTWSYTFRSPGSYSYSSTVDTTMTGLVVVS